MTRRRALLLSILWALLLCATPPTLALERSDILLDLVTHCIDSTPANYCSLCRVPRKDSACATSQECKKTTEVWALNAEYTAIRDIKMCGCPSEFVHGLALPRATVRGVEDPARPDGIWQFAWDTAVQRIPVSDLALVVNPQADRSQNQLHVHLLRLAPGAREKLDTLRVDRITQLRDVWSVAARGAATRGLEDYGVLVAQNSAGSFDVVISATSPESLFTQYRCD